MKLDCLNCGKPAVCVWFVIQSVDTTPMYYTYTEEGFTTTAKIMAHTEMVPLCEDCDLEYPTNEYTYRAELGKNKKKSIKKPKLLPKRVIRFEE